MIFRALVEPVGRATGVAVPAEIIDSFGSGKRPKVLVSINGHSWRSAVVPMGGRYIIGIGTANRTASGIVAGDEVDVELHLDEEPRQVAEPPDLAAALDGDSAARAAFDRLPYGNKRRTVIDIERARTPETRQRRIVKAIATLRREQR